MQILRLSWRSHVYDNFYQKQMKSIWKNSKICKRNAMLFHQTFLQMFMKNALVSKSYSINSEGRENENIYILFCWLDNTIFHICFWGFVSAEIA